jgi:hypothetical protein
MSVGKCANRPPPTSGAFQAATVVEAEQRLAEFEVFWSAAYLSIVQIWLRNWDLIFPFFDYPPEIRRNIYTINAIKSVNMSLRKITKNRGSFLSDEALSKPFYLALMNISKNGSCHGMTGKPLYIGLAFNLTTGCQTINQPRSPKIQDTLAIDEIVEGFGDLYKLQEISGLFRRVD